MTVSRNQNENASQPIPQEAFDWYDEYAHGVIDKRTFMARLATLTAAGFTMSMLLSALLPDYALAEQVSFNDPDIKARYVTFPSPKGHTEGQGYLVVPAALTGKAPVVLVVHENRGLNPYIEDVARRLAKAGFVAFAPDALRLHHAHVSECQPRLPQRFNRKVQRRSRGIGLEAHPGILHQSSDLREPGPETWDGPGRPPPPSAST